MKIDGTMAFLAVLGPAIMYPTKIIKVSVSLLEHC